MKKNSLILLCLCLLFSFNTAWSQETGLSQDKKSATQQALVTVELKDIDVAEVLKILARKGNINMIIGQNVKGRITLLLTDVSVWDALKSVFEIANLAYIKKGNIYQVMTGRDYLQQNGREFFDNREMKIIPLYHADANEALSSVKGLVSKIGTVNIDARTNSLIVVDSGATIKMIEDAISRIDRPLVTEVFTLEYLSITQAEEIIKSLITKKGRYQKDSATNKMIVSDTPGNIERVKMIIGEYDVAPTVETKVYRLDYGSYEKIEPKIKEFLTPNIGRISSDERTNSIIVIDIASNIRRIDEIIAAYDQKTREVLIEAKIVQVQLNDRFQYGINWNYIFENAAETLDYNVLSAFELVSQVVDDSEEDEDSPEKTDTPFSDLITSPAEGGARVVVTGSLNENDFDAVINALKVVGDAKVLSSPRIMVTDGQDAKIQVATREAYVTETVSQGQSSTTTAENVTFVDVGVILTVTPKINNSGFIQMKIKPEVSAVDSTIQTSKGNTIPIVAKQEVETNVLVKDGVTIILGGLMEEVTSKDSRKIPLLGDIPILGMAFRKETKRVRKKEMVLFLTPYIISGDKSFYEDSPVPVSPEILEVYETETPEYYRNPIKKTGDFIKDEFLQK